jgi:hypothetical protein
MTQTTLFCYQVQQRNLKRLRPNVIRVDGKAAERIGAIIEDVWKVIEDMWKRERQRRSLADLVVGWRPVLLYFPFSQVVLRNNFR